jgi:hypothetical protein
VEEDESTAGEDGKTRSNVTEKLAFDPEASLGR